MVVVLPLSSAVMRRAPKVRIVGGARSLVASRVGGEPLANRYRAVSFYSLVGRRSIKCGSESMRAGDGVAVQPPSVIKDGLALGPRTFR
jgi:hypothetical protein